MFKISSIFIFLSAAVYVQSVSNLCFNCNGVPSQSDCDVIAPCPNDESCYVRKSTQFNGKALFESGCLSKQTCQSLNVIASIGKREADLTNCFECCHTGNNTHPCNSQLCGTPPSPIRKCFSCSDAAHPGDCQNAVSCSEDEMCYTGSYRHSFSQEFRYNLRCMPKDTCKIFQSMGHNHMTSSSTGDSSETNHCNDCCDDDYCNLGLCGIPKRVKPVFTYKPNNSTLRPEYEGVILVCKTEPMSNATLHWEFKGPSGNKVISGPSVTIAPNNVNLTIFPAHQSDLGEYICVATNSVGTSTSSAFIRPK